jgi:hypothetical protein
MGIQRDGRGQPDPYISGTNEVCRYHGAWYSETPDTYIKLQVQLLQGGIPYTNSNGPEGTVGVSINDNGTFYCDIAIPSDISLSHRVAIRRDGVWEVTSMQAFKSVAMAVEFQNVQATVVDGTSVAFYGQWKPNTTESTGTAYLYYKKTTDVSWTLHGTYGPYSGSGWQAISQTITGLDYGTSYQFYIYVSRTVSNNLWAGQGTYVSYGGITYGYLPTANASSSTVSASTLAATPTVTSEDASSVSHVSAVLNGTIDANSLPSGVDVSFLWNSQAYRRVDYNNGVNVTNGKVLTIGAITYTFLTNSTATGQFAYSGQPSPLDTIVIEGSTYTFVNEVVSTGGKIAYVNGTQPTHGKIVTLPTAGGVPGIYKFKNEVAASGGKLAYINGTNPAITKTVTIPVGGPNPDAVYTFVSTVAQAGDVKRAGNADATMLNLAHAINKSGGTEGAGGDYISWNNAAHPLVSAAQDAGADEINLTVLSVGSVGNITISTTDASITPTSPTGGSQVEDAGDVLIGANADATMLNLSRAINNSGGTSGVGNDYIAYNFGAGPAAHPLFSATHSAGSDWITFTTLAAGHYGNADFTSDESSFTITDPSGGDQVEVAGDVLIGADADATFLNLTRAINNSGGTPGVGNDYLPWGGGANSWVSAVHNSGPNTVSITALSSGAAGNSIDLSDTSAAVTTTVMSGGTDLPGGGYQVLIGTNADATMLNLKYAINKDGGVEGINYVAAAAHPYVTAAISAIDNYVTLVVPTNTNPTLTFSTDEATFTLTTETSAPWSNETTPVNYANDGTTPFSAVVSGLALKRTYFFKAKAVYTANGGGTLYGSDKTFTTATEPLAASLEEDLMQTLQFDGQYGVAKTITFTLRAPSGSSSDLFYTSTAPVQADCLIYKDGVYDSTSDNAPTQVSTYLYKLTLSAAEMQCEMLDLVIHDASGASFRDQHIQVRTAMRLSELDIDASQGPTNADAITAIGNGDGDGIIATSTGNGNDINAVLSSMWLRVGYAQTQSSPSGVKIKLDSNASPTDNYYNGCVVVTLDGDGAGQARVVVSYNGGQREATVDSSWSTIPNNTTIYALGAGARPWNLSPAAELASVPGPTAGYGEMLQLVFQRFANKIDQTASAQTWYDSAGNAIFDRAVSDDGVTQTVEALANV